MARGLGLPAQLRGANPLRRPLPLARAVPRLGAAAPSPARPGRARPLRHRAGRDGRRARRAHPLRPRGRRAGDRPPHRLQGVRLALAGQPDGFARPRRAGGRGGAVPHLRARPVRGLLHAQRALEAAARARRPLRRRTELRAPRLPLPGAYRCGQVWGISIEVAGLRFYHQGSANLVDEAVRERDVDVFLAGVAGRSFTDRYWQRILPRLNPRAVVPTHYDNFFRPLGSRLEFVANVQLAALPDEIGTVSRDIEVACLPRADLA